MPDFSLTNWCEGLFDSLTEIQNRFPHENWTTVPIKVAVETSDKIKEIEKVVKSRPWGWILILRSLQKETTALQSKLGDEITLQVTLPPTMIYEEKMYLPKCESACEALFCVAYYQSLCQFSDIDSGPPIVLEGSPDWNIHGVNDRKLIIDKFAQRLKEKIASYLSVNENIAALSGIHPAFQSLQTVIKSDDRLSLFSDLALGKQPLIVPASPVLPSSLDRDEPDVGSTSNSLVLTDVQSGDDLEDIPECPEDDDVGLSQIGDAQDIDNSVRQNLTLEEKLGLRFQYLFSQFLEQSCHSENVKNPIVSCYQSMKEKALDVSRCLEMINVCQQIIQFIEGGCSSQETYLGGDIAQYFGETDRTIVYDFISYLINTQEVKQLGSIPADAEGAPPPALTAMLTLSKRVLQENVKQLNDTPVAQFTKDDFSTKNNADMLTLVEKSKLLVMIIDSMNTGLETYIKDHQNWFYRELNNIFKWIRECKFSWLKNYFVPTRWKFVYEAEKLNAELKELQTKFNKGDIGSEFEQVVNSAKTKIRSISDEPRTLFYTKNESINDTNLENELLDLIDKPTKVNK